MQLELDSYLTRGIDRNCTEPRLELQGQQLKSAFGPDKLLSFPENRSYWLLGEHTVPLPVKAPNGTTLGQVTLFTHGFAGWECRQDHSVPLPGAGARGGGGVRWGGARVHAHAPPLCVHRWRL